MPSSQKKGLAQLLVDLAADPDLVEHAKKDPDSVLGNYALSTDERAAVHETLKTGSGNPLKKILPQEELKRFQKNDIVSS